MKDKTTIDFMEPLPAIQAQMDQCRRISPQRVQSGEDAHLVVEKPE